MSVINLGDCSPEPAARLLLVRLAMEYLALEEATSEAAIAVTLGDFETDCEMCSADVNLVNAEAEWYGDGG